MTQRLSVLKLTISILSVLIFANFINAQPPQSPQMQAAIQLVRALKWAEAATSLEEIVKSEPNNPRSWFLLGVSYHQLGQYDKAIIAYEKNIPISKNPSAMYNLACSYARLKNSDKAFEWLENSLKGGVIANANFKTDEDLANIREDARFRKIEETVDRLSRPCMYQPESRQFDFWIGEWDVFPSQAPPAQAPKVGSNRVERISEGCGLLENWGSQTDNGKSINFYDSNTGKWHQYWIGSPGNVLRYEGIYQANAMRFEGITVGKDGKKIMQKLTFFKVDENTVRQLAEISNDEGKTWTTSYDFRYVRKK